MSYSQKTFQAKKLESLLWHAPLTHHACCNTRQFYKQRPATKGPKNSVHGQKVHECGTRQERPQPSGNLPRSEQAEQRLPRTTLAVHRFHRCEPKMLTHLQWSHAVRPRKHCSSRHLAWLLRKRTIRIKRMSELIFACTGASVIASDFATIQTTSRNVPCKFISTSIG